MTEAETVNDTLRPASDDQPVASSAPARVPTIPADEHVADLADVFGLLGDPGRMRLLIALLPGPLRVNELAEVSGLSQSATSHALRLLRAHRVVDVHREGRAAVYDIADAHVRDFLELGLEHVGHTVLIHTVATETRTDASASASAECAPAHSDHPDA